MAIKITDTKMIHDGWGKFLIATIRLADGQTVTREIEDHGHAVGVLAYDPARRTAILVKQFRAPMLYANGLDHTLEVIAGGRQGNDPVACMKREALEEAGLRLGDLEHVITGMNMPGVSTMCIDLYLATYQKDDFVSAGGGVPDEREDIEIVEMKLPELARMLEQGAPVDLSTAMLVQTLRLRRPELFSEAA